MNCIFVKDNLRICHRSSEYSNSGCADFVVMCVIVHLHVIRQDTGPRITDFVALGK